MAKRKKMSIIEKYRLDPEEVLALKISHCWITLCQKYFPNYKHTRLRNGDPRKSIIFKISYKLQRETKGLIPENEYELYVRAQLEILKYQSQNNPMVLIDPMCLVGDKAWKRWKLWKKKYDAKLNSKAVSKPKNFNKLGEKKAIEGILKTKKFLDENLPKNPQVTDFIEHKNNLISWINFGKISPYYLVVSPYIAKVFNKQELSRLNFDISFYQDCITEEVKEIFKKIFKNEF